MNWMWLVVVGLSAFLVGIGLGRHMEWEELRRVLKQRVIRRNIRKRTAEFIKGVEQLGYKYSGPIYDPPHN
jgi:hypothetical protein